LRPEQDIDAAKDAVLGSDDSDPFDAYFVDELPGHMSVPLSSSMLEVNRTFEPPPKGADFFVNIMMNKNPWVPAAGYDARLSIQSAMFRWISAASYRAYTQDRKWCYSTWKTKATGPLLMGRQYWYTDFRAFAIHLIHLYRALNFDPECGNDELGKSPLTVLEKVLTDQAVLKFNRFGKYAWWEDVFLPALVEAFSCGFTDEDATLTDEKLAALPIDIRADFEAGEENHILAKIWRLTKGYLLSPQKQRENIVWQNDFAVSLYVPFMRMYIPSYDLCGKGDCWTKRAMMRCGAPTYTGPAIWYCFHVFAHVAAQPMKEGILCDAARAMLFDKFATVLKFFAVAGQPCPCCREHFLTQVSRNDRLSELFLERQESESDQYPLEWLFLGPEEWDETTIGTPNAKFSTIDPKNPESIKLFFWKLHNAVTASVKYGMDCRESEGYDEYEGSIYACTEGNHPQQARAWPFLRRFAFWLPEGEWEAVRVDEDVKNAVEKLKALDGVGLRSELWVEKPILVEVMDEKEKDLSDDGLTGTDVRSKFDVKTEAINEVIAAIKELDEAILASKVLDKVYETAVPDSTKFDTCVKVHNSLDRFHSFVEPAPILEPAPDGCQKLLAAKAKGR